LLKRRFADAEKVLLTLPPSATGAAEPGAVEIADEIDAAFTKFLNVLSSPEKVIAERALREALWNSKAGIIAYLRRATPPVRGDRTTVNRAADEVVRRVSEYNDRTSPDDFPEALLITPSELHNELTRFADDLSLPVQPGAGERDLLVAATRMRDMLTADGDPPSIFIPNDIVDAGDANEFTQAFDELAKAIRAYRQPPQSSREG
jgi:hypothetical protein